MYKILFALLFSCLFNISFAVTDTVTNTNDLGTGSLREAIDSSNHGDTIRFHPNLIAGGSDTITLTSRISFNKNLVIKGQFNSSDTLFVSGGGNDRVFFINNLANKVVLDSMFIINANSTLVTVANKYALGGGVYFEGDSLIVLNCFFKNNSTNSSGGGFYSTSKYLKVFNTSFKSNLCRSAGAGFFNDSRVDSEVIISNSTFVKNIADHYSTNGRGGAFFSFSDSVSRLSIDSSFFSHNLASEMHSSILYNAGDKSSEMDIDNSFFCNNFGGIYGGTFVNPLISSSSSLLYKITNTVYENNMRGILLTDIDSLIIKNTKIKNNTYGNGYGVLAQGTRQLKYVFFDSLEINNCDKGILLDTRDFTLENSLIINNQSFGIGNGYNSTTSTSRNVIKNTIISNNAQGIIISNASKILQIENSTIEDNKGSATGAGMNVNTDTLIVKNTTISGNKTPGAGGGIFAGVNYFKIKSSTISGNSANNGSALVINFKRGFKYGLIDNSTIVYNKDSTGNAILGANIHVNIGSSIIALNGQKSNFTGTNPTITSLGYNFFSDSVLQGFSSADSLNSDSSALLLGELSFNGGATKTILPDTGSVVINSGNPSDTSNAQNRMVYLTRDAGSTEYNCSLVILIDTVFETNASYYWRGRNYFTSGIKNYVVTNISGCDSVYRLNLTLNHPAIFDTVCAFYISPSGAVLTKSGIHKDVLKNIMGCDSIIYINLIVRNSYDTSSISLCNSPFYSPSGKLFSVSGTYLDTLPNFIGCDSVFIINLTIGNTSFDTITENICGTSYISPSGKSYFSTGVYYDTIINLSGCDSIIQINLIINQVSFSSISRTSCFSFIAPSGKTYNNSVLFSDTITNSVGCDSIITINLTITNFNKTVAQSSGVNLTANEAGVTYQWLDCNKSDSIITNETNQTFTATINGSYSVQITKNSCIDTSACYLVNSVGLSENEINTGISIYPNPNNGTFTLQFEKKQQITSLFITDINGRIIKQITPQKVSQYEINFEGASGIYFLNLVSENDSRTIKIIKN